MAVPPPFPTPFPALNEVLAALLEAVRIELGPRFVGMYLQGSFAVGDPDPHSDCDWIVVVRDAIEDASGLQRMHERIYAMPSPWAQHLEGSYVPAAELRAFSPDTEPWWYIDNGSRVLERSRHDDTLVVRWCLLEHGIELDGPPLDTLIDPVDPDAVRTEVRAIGRAWAKELLADPAPLRERWCQEFAAVFYCRWLHTLETGTVVSKPEAVAWARPRLDTRWRALIDRAVARRAETWNAPSAAVDEFELAETVEFVRAVAGGT